MSGPSRFPKLPTAPPPGPPPAPRAPGFPARESSAERRRREMRRAALITGFAVLVAAVAVLGIVVLVRPTTPAIDVTAIYIVSTDDACGASGVNWTGYTTGSGGSSGLSIPITNPSYVNPCTISTVRSMTPGFSVAGPTDLPATIPGGSSIRLVFVVLSPNGTYHGNLTLDAE